MRKIRIKRYPPRNLSTESESSLESIADSPLSEREREFLMLYKANPHHPLIIEECSEIVEIEVNDKAFKELMWVFKKYRVPFKPIKEGVEIKHIKAEC